MTVRSIWTGTLAMGPLVLPVKLGTVAGEDKLPLHQVRKSDGSRIEMKRFAVADGREVPYSDVVRGYETVSGQVVLVTDADFELAYGAKNREARITGFTPRDSVPRTAADTSYYVEPGKGGEKAYRLLATALERQGKAAVVSVAIRQREAQALLYPVNGYLVLERLQWAENLRLPDFAAPSEKVTEAEIELAENYISLLSGEWNWTAQKDTSAQALADVIQAKAETGQVVGTPAERKPGSTTAPADLEAVLRASVEAAKAAKAPAPAPVRKPRTKKAAA
jgi:DNA end-binding protein Ku